MATIYAGYASLNTLKVEDLASLYEEDYGLSGEEDSEDDAVEDGMAEHEAAPEPGTADWKQIIANLPPAPKLSLGAAYQFEKQDTKHRMGDLLKGCFTVYQQKHPGDPSGANFYKWLDEMPDLDRVLMVSNAASAGAASAHLMRGSATDNIKPSMVKAFMKGVAYLDKAGRKSHRVHFKGGTAFQTTKEGAQQELSTAEMSTVFSGKGFGIWVMSEKGKLYVGNHIKGMVHHSSFLAGADVMCGGEMWARNGKIQFLSAKSGHYQPDKSNLRWALQVFETCVSNYGEIKVAVWKGNPGRIHLFSPSDCFMNNDWEAWGRLNRDEDARLKAGNFASFPSA